MRKPLIALGLAVTTSLGVLPAAETLAAPAANPSLGTKQTNTYRYQTSSASPSTRSANTVSGAQIVDTALRYIGAPYAITGDSPVTGFSCIGFVSYVYHLNGINLPGDLGGALAYAPSVPFSQLQPGDILYFQNTIWNGLSHTGIYIGNGRFIHAEWYGKGVRISSFNNDKLDGNYWITKYLGANRPWGGAAVQPVIGGGTPSVPRSGAVVAPGTGVSGPVAGGTAAVVTVTSLNVRTSPSRSSGVQTIVNQGTNVTIIGRSPGWYKVQLPDGTIGWVIRAGVSKGAGAVVSPGASAQSNPVAANPTVGNPTAPRTAVAPALTRTRSASQRATTRITATGLRVHTAPSVGAPVVTSLYAGQKVQVLARGNGWMKIRTASGQVGWVVTSYTSHPTGTIKAAGRTASGAGKSAASRAGTVRVTASSRGSVLTAGVRIHAAPGVNARVVGMAPAGTHVVVLSSANGWALVRLPNGQTGYVDSMYIKR